MDAASPPNGPKSRKPYPPELKERSVRMVKDHRGDYPSRMAAIRSVATKMGVHWTTLHAWTKQAETDAGKRPGLTTEETEELRQLRRENKELRRANEILKSASAFFAAEFDGRHSK